MSATPPSRRSILSLYSALMRTSRSFSSYNFRQYFVRQTQERFRTLQSESDPVKINVIYRDAVKDLAVLRRSAIVNQLYGGWKLAVESNPKIQASEGEILREEGV